MSANFFSVTLHHEDSTTYPFCHEASLGSSPLENSVDFPQLFAHVCKRGRRRRRRVGDTPGRMFVWIVASRGVSLFVDGWSFALPYVHHVCHGIPKVNISDS